MQFTFPLAMTALAVLAALRDVSARPRLVLVLAIASALAWILALTWTVTG